MIEIDDDRPAIRIQKILDEYLRSAGTGSLRRIPSVDCMVVPPFNIVLSRFAGPAKL